MTSPTTPPCRSRRFGLFPFRSPLLRESLFAFFSCGYLDVSVPRVRPAHLWIQCTVIQESRDQCSFDSFPGLFAAFHVLHRLLTPRHPPHALSSLTTMIPASQPHLAAGRQQTSRSPNILRTKLTRNKNNEFHHIDGPIARNRIYKDANLVIKPNCQRSIHSPEATWRHRFRCRHAASDSGNITNQVRRLQVTESRFLKSKLRIVKLSVEKTGLEPATSAVQGRRSPS